MPAGMQQRNTAHECPLLLWCMCNHRHEQTPKTLNAGGGGGAGGRAAAQRRAGGPGCAPLPAAAGGVPGRVPGRPAPPRPHPHPAGEVYINTVNLSTTYHHLALPLGVTFQLYADVKLDEWSTAADIGPCPDGTGVMVQCTVISKFQGLCSRTALTPSCSLLLGDLTRTL